MTQLYNLFQSGKIISVTQDYMNGKRFVWHANTHHDKETETTTGFTLTGNFKEAKRYAKEFNVPIIKHTSS